MAWASGSGKTGGVALLLAFSVVLLIGVLLSGLAHRSVLSTAVLFLLAGFLLGDGMIGVVQLRAEDELVTVLACTVLGAVHRWAAGRASRLGRRLAACLVGHCCWGCH